MTPGSQLDRIEHMLEELLSKLANGNQPPVYQPTVDDEIAAVQAQGGSLREYFRQRSKQPRRK